MAIQDSNPITGNTNCSYVEVSGSHVAADKDSGLIYGHIQLPEKVDPDRWFEELTGTARPDTYKEELQSVIDASDAELGVPDVVVQSAKDVLNPDTNTSVLVTTLNRINTGRRIGAPTSTDIGRLQLQPHDLNVGTLPIRDRVDEDEKDSMYSDGAQDTVGTIAARAAADKLRIDTDPQPKATTAAKPDPDAPASPPRKVKTTPDLALTPAEDTGDQDGLDAAAAKQDEEARLAEETRLRAEADKSQENS